MLEDYSESPRTLDFLRSTETETMARIAFWSDFSASIIGMVSCRIGIDCDTYQLQTVHYRQTRSSRRRCMKLLPGQTG